MAGTPGEGASTSRRERKQERTGPEGAPLPPTWSIHSPMPLSRPPFTDRSHPPAPDSPPSRLPMATPALDSAVNTPSAGPRTAGGRVVSAGGDEALVDRLAAELAAAWRQGERLLV